MIPVQPVPYDVWAASDVVTLVSEARQFKPNLDAVFVINRKIVNMVYAPGEDRLADVSFRGKS